jgi:hypothetical protein
MTTRGQKVAEQIRETIERRIAARVAASDVAGVRAILEVVEYGVEIAAGSLGRMGETVETGPETGWGAPAAMAQELIAERDAAIANAKQERKTITRLMDERDALRENSRIQGEKIEALIESRNHAVQSADSLSQELSATIKGRAQLLAERDALLSELETQRATLLRQNEQLANQHRAEDADYIAAAHDPEDRRIRELETEGLDRSDAQATYDAELSKGQPAEVLGMVKVHSGDDIPEPTPPPRGAPAKIDRRRAKQAKADKKAAKEGAWGKAQYNKVTDPESGQKLSMGKGCAVHPSKKGQYKIQGEKDPDTKNARAMVAKIRPEPVFPTVPEDLDKASQLITPAPHAEKPEGLLDHPTYTPNPADADARSKFMAERERVNKHNAEVREAFERRQQAAQADRRKETSRKLSHGNLAAYKALKFWVHHRIPQTRGLTAQDRSEMNRSHGDAIREIAEQVAKEHNTTRRLLAEWVADKIDRHTGAMIGAGAVEIAA